MNSVLDSRMRKAFVREISPNSVRIVAPGLARDTASGGIDDDGPAKLFSDPQIRRIENEIYARLKKLDLKRKLPYHNVGHTKNVVRRVSSLSAVAGLARWEKQLLRVAALFHDYEHGYHPPGSKKLTNEERSAIAADKWAVKAGFNRRQRLTLYGLIISTTFSNPHIFPGTRLEKLLVNADLGGVKNAPRTWLLESLKVNLELPPGLRPPTLQAWINDQQKFLEYVRVRLTAEAKKLRWDKGQKEKKRILKQLQKKPFSNKTYSPILRRVESSLTAPLSKSH